MREHDATEATKAGKNNLQFVRERQASARRKRVLQSPRGGLQIIADRLNEVPALQHEVEDPDCPRGIKAECEAWTLVDTIVSASSLSKAGVLFTVHAAQHPVNMCVEVRKGTPRTPVSSREATGTALWHLWLYYFRDRGWRHLKRCTVCHRWFVDTSNNKAQARCSAVCTWQWWSRERRKKYHHKTKGAQSHGGKKHR